MVDLLIRQDTLRAFNVHLSSPQINGTMEISDNTGFFERVYHYIRILFDTEVQRSTEIRLLQSLIEANPYAVLVAGDFNQLAYGFNYRRMLRPLKDAFRQKGEGLGITLDKNNLPPRIDYQRYDPNLPLESFEVDYAMDHSDHYPLRASYRFLEDK
jgi:endonuclease/exonuclease/phosphatase (EEP) superfamily protein YafD